MNAGDRRRTVVVGIDGSEEALRAVRWAVPEARRRRATLRLVTAFAWTDDRMVGWPGLGQTAYGDRLRAFAENGLTGRCGDGARPRPARRAGSRPRFPGGRPGRAVPRRRAARGGRPRAGAGHLGTGGFRRGRRRCPLRMPGRGGPRHGGSQ